MSEHTEHVEDDENAEGSWLDDEAAADNENVDSSDNTDSLVKIDAHEFGQHIRRGGWRLGLLVARSVQPGKPGRPKSRAFEDSEGQDTQTVENRPPEAEKCSAPTAWRKVSMNTFASLAGVARSHVQYHYKAWQLAADAGLCQHAEQLSPGEEDASLDIDEDDDGQRAKWLQFYHEGREENEEAQTSNTTGSKQGSTSKPKKKRTPEDDLDRAVEAFSNTSVQLLEKLVKVAQFAELVDNDVLPVRLARELRQDRVLLERQFELLDRVLERMDFGDAEEEPEEDAEDVEDVEAVEDSVDVEDVENVEDATEVTDVEDATDATDVTSVTSVGETEF